MRTNLFKDASHSIYWISHNLGASCTNNNDVNKQAGGKINNVYKNIYGSEMIIVKSQGALLKNNNNNNKLWIK